ncbi:hypothetical protein sscle_09g069330 [Sclerotinia sclerotiorum 1980 UF-70]|uniref:C2H2-type domain-containing protein n=1 Tax=Sclerotinia sclerotiorum (strain ATCC 18683 / 1980 / Ss-1) TaxID=665079 RepID=A0A1D9QC24_SCLS1|nr:hypothetical protein sscle_09g069330 [Sclerotinia sclerotiorum 1980 UF-70]
MFRQYCFPIGQKKPIFIHGTTITLKVEGWSEIESDDMDSEAEKKEAEYARYLARASEDETSVSPDEESDDMDSGAEGKEADYARDQAEASEASEDKISVLSDEEREEEYLGDNSPTRYFLSRKTLALKRKQLSTCEICKEEYHSTDNQKNCYTHRGNKVLVPRAEFWREHVYRFWTKNKKRRRVDDPAFGQGFSWTCCRKTGNAVGCEVSSHRPKLEDSSNKRTKV